MVPFVLWDRQPHFHSPHQLLDDILGCRVPLQHLCKTNKTGSIVSLLQNGEIPSALSSADAVLCPFPIQMALMLFLAEGAAHWNINLFE